MNWQSLKDPDLQKFIRTHEGAEVATLALKKPPAGFEGVYPLVLEQIKARQKARKKVPQWFEKEGENALVFPPANVVEQASSAACALYKAGLVSGEVFVDLTGGMGVDSWALSQKFTRGVCVERDDVASALLSHNFKALSLDSIGVVQGDAEGFVRAMTALVDLVYIDPQRRDTGKQGRFSFKNGAPDVLALLPLLAGRTRRVMLKTSPMLDITEGIRALTGVSHVQTIEFQGDCKEVLYILDMNAQTPEDEVRITATSIDSQGAAEKSFSFQPCVERVAQKNAEFSRPLQFLYEPGPAFQKAGGFYAMAAHYGLKKLHPHTHLYTSAVLRPDFCGRSFEVLGLYPVQAGKLPVERANLTIRNFPARTEDLRKKLKLKDGGEDTVFACTVHDDTRMLVHCRKV